MLGFADVCQELFTAWWRRLLRVTFGSKPSDAALAVHPLVNFRFALEALDVNRLNAGTFGQNIPVALGNPHRFETYFCFGHAL